MSDSYLLAIKVVPGASRSAIAGWLGDELKIRIAAPPEKGKANSAVLKLLATTFGIHKQAISIVRGHTSAHKTVSLSGIQQSDIDRTFGVRETRQ